MQELVLGACQRKHRASDPRVPGTRLAEAKAGWCAFPLPREFCHLLSEASTARAWELVPGEKMGSFILEVRGRFV